MDRAQSIYRALIETIKLKTGINPKVIKASMIAIVVAVVCSLAYFGYSADRGFQVNQDNKNDKSNYDQTALQQTTVFDDPPEPEPAAIENLVVYLTGAVNNPGLYTLNMGSRIGDAVAAAGGMSENAATQAINLAELLSDGSQIHIPTKEEALDSTFGQLTNTPANTNSSDKNAASSTSLNSGLININTADIGSLQTLDGIGPATAQKIVDYRKANGAFKRKEDLKNVSGIGEKKYAAIEAKITI